MPRVSAGGRTYTFRIRSGFRFSPPSNELVTAATFKRTLERAFSPKIGHGGRRPVRGARDRGPRPVRRRQGGSRFRDQGARRHAVDHAGRAVRRLPDPHLAAVSLPCPVHRAVPPEPRSRAAVVRALLRVIDGRRPRRAAAEPGLRRRAVAAVGTDRLHARRPHAARRGARRSRRRSTTCRSTSTATRCSGATARSRIATGRGARPHGGAASATSSRRARSSTTSS